MSRLPPAGNPGFCEQLQSEEGGATQGEPYSSVLETFVQLKKSDRDLRVLWCLHRKLQLLSKKESMGNRSDLYCIPEIIEYMSTALRRMLISPATAEDRLSFLLAISTAWTWLAAFHVADRLQLGFQIAWNTAVREMLDRVFGLEHNAPLLGRSLRFLSYFVFTESATNTERTLSSDGAGILRFVATTLPNLSVTDCDPYLAESILQFIACCGIYHPSLNPFLLQSLVQLALSLVTKFPQEDTVVGAFAYCVDVHIASFFPVVEQIVMLLSRFLQAQSVSDCTAGYIMSALMELFERLPPDHAIVIAAMDASLVSRLCHLAAPVTDIQLATRSWNLIHASLVRHPSLAKIYFQSLWEALPRLDAQNQEEVYAAWGAALPSHFPIYGGPFADLRLRLKVSLQTDVPQAVADTIDDVLSPSVVSLILTQAEFSPHIVHVLTSILQDKRSQVYHASLDSFINRWLEHAIYGPLTDPVCFPNPIAGTLRNEVILSSTKQGTPVRVVNMSPENFFWDLKNYDERLQAVLSDINKAFPSRDGCRRWYHGTPSTHWESIAYKLDHKMNDTGDFGGFCRDDWDSVYLGEDVIQVAHHARSRPNTYRTNYSAIFVFDEPDLRCFEPKLCFDDAGDQWKSFVQNSRENAANESARSTGMALNAKLIGHHEGPIHYVLGPSSNWSVPCPRERISPLPRHPLQIAVKSESLTDAFHANLRGVIFLPQGDELVDDFPQLV